MPAQVIPLRSQLERMPASRTPTDVTEWSQDYAVTDKEALTVKQLEAWLYEIREQPDWRRQCDIDADYYDGHQLTADVLERLRQKGFPAIKENLTRPTIDAVLGLEAKTRTDWVVKPDHDQWEDVARAMSVKMKEAERESQADKACSDAYAPQIKVGIGWVEVSREIVPYRYPYRVRYVHRREIAWDWRSKEPDMSDARYLVRRQWFDEDVVLAMFPKHKKLIQMIGNQWLGWWDDVIKSGDTGLASSYEIERATTIQEYEFRDYLRNRLCVYEIWYRTWKALPMLKLPDNRWVEYDRKNRLHVAAVAQGLIVPQVLPVPKVRLSFWIGPHRLIDVPSPYRHHHFPYVPFFGYREDLSTAPYGLIRNMRDQQDEVNARKQKMMWLLSSRQVVVDNDAVLDHQKTADEVARADAYIVLNENRKPSSKLEIQDNMQLSDQQFKVYENAKQSLQDVAGVYQAMLGKESSAESGIAINSLIEQGTITLAEINDNYRYARRQVGRMLMELVREDIANGDTVTVGEGMQRHEVTLNEDAVDEMGPYVRNDVQRAGVNLVLDDVPSTATYRQQQLAYITEFAKGLPDDMKAIIADFIVEGSDLPQRREIGERFRQHLGMQSDRPPRTPEEAQKQAAAQQEAARKADLVRRGEAAEVEKLEGEAAKAKAEAAQLASGGEQQIAQERQAMLADVQKQVEDIVVKAQDEISALQAKVDALQSALKSKGDEARVAADADTTRARIEAGAKIAVARIEQQRDDIVATMNNSIDQTLRKFGDQVAKQMRELAERVAATEKKSDQSASDTRKTAIDVSKLTAPIDAAVEKINEATEAALKRLERPAGARTISVRKPDGTTMEVTVEKKSTHGNEATLEVTVTPNPTKES